MARINEGKILSSDWPRSSPVFSRQPRFSPCVKWAQWIVWTEGMSTLLRIPLSDHRLVAHVPSTHIFGDDFHDFEEQERSTVLDHCWFPLQSIGQRATLFAQSPHNSPMLVWTINVTHRRVKGEVLISLEETSILAHWMSVDQEFIDVIWCWWMTGRRIALCRSSSHLERRTLEICWWRSVLVVPKCIRRVNTTDFSAREHTRDVALVFLSMNVFPLTVIHQSRQHRRKARPAKHSFTGTVLTGMENERFSSLIRFILVFLLDRIFERVGWCLERETKTRKCRWSRWLHLVRHRARMAISLWARLHPSSRLFSSTVVSSIQSSNRINWKSSPSCPLPRCHPLTSSSHCRCSPKPCCQRLPISLRNAPRSFPLFKHLISLRSTPLRQCGARVVLRRCSTTGNEHADRMSIAQTFPRRAKIEVWRARRTARLSPRSDFVRRSTHRRGEQRCLPRFAEFDRIVFRWTLVGRRPRSVLLESLRSDVHSVPRMRPFSGERFHSLGRQWRRCVLVACLSRMANEEKKKEQSPDLLPSKSLRTDGALRCVLAVQQRSDLSRERQRDRLRRGVSMNAKNNNRKLRQRQSEGEENEHTGLDGVWTKESVELGNRRDEKRSASMSEVREFLPEWWMKMKTEEMFVSSKVHRLNQFGQSEEIPQ